MTDMANFLNRREKINWTVSSLPDGTRVYLATSSDSLKDMTWVFPKANYSQPIVFNGLGSISLNLGHAKPRLKLRQGSQISQDPNEWLVTAGDGNILVFLVKPL
jgi:hypothetical protein